jgi:hypothetical protein
MLEVKYKKIQELIFSIECTCCKGMVGQENCAFRKEKGRTDRGRYDPLTIKVVYCLFNQRPARIFPARDAAFNDPRIITVHL